MAVYFAATQARNFGRLFHGSQIRAWIRTGRTSRCEKIRKVTQILPEIEQSACNTSGSSNDNTIRGERDIASRAKTPNEKIPANEVIDGYTKQEYYMDTNNYDEHEDLIFDVRTMVLDPKDIEKDITPAPVSIIALSAPFVLLSSSVYTFLAGIGVYLGFLYTKGLGNSDSAGMEDNRNIFFVFVAAITTCHTIYDIANKATADGTVWMNKELKKHAARTARRMEHELGRVKGKIDELVRRGVVKKDGMQIY